MAMDATVLLISKDKSKLNELTQFLDGLEGISNNLYCITKEDSFKHNEWFIDELDARGAYPYDIHEELLSCDKLHMLDDVYLVYWNDYEDSVVILTSNEVLKCYFLGDWYEKKFDIPEQYSNIPIKDILTKRLS